MTDQVNVFRIDDSLVAAGAPRPTAMPKSAGEKPRPKLAATATKKTAESPAKAANGSARSMQTALATAVNAQPDWKEF